MRTALRRRLLESWSQRGALALALWPMSVLYGALVALRRNLFRWGVWRVERVPVPVIVVGNVVAGGAGKTPVVLELVRHLQARGFSPGVVSRGYGRTTRGCREVDAGSQAHEVGDEPLLIRRKTGVPVVVAETRVQAARALLAAHPDVDVLVCDDGLQHHALHRDLEICVFDQGGAGNGFLLPAGPLREPWPRPVDLVLFSGPDWAGPGYRMHRQLGSHALRADGAQMALDSLGHRPRTAGGDLHAVAGIAQPERFFAMLRARGLQLAQTHALPDHARFGPQELVRFEGKTLICTEKDATKLWALFPDALAVPLELRLEPDFWDAIDQWLGTGARPKLSSPHGHTPS